MKISMVIACLCLFSAAAAQAEFSANKNALFGWGLSAECEGRIESCKERCDLAYPRYTIQLGIERFRCKRGSTPEIVCQ